jgi:hypothetical protein
MVNGTPSIAIFNRDSPEIDPRVARGDTVGSSRMKQDGDGARV